MAFAIPMIQRLLDCPQPFFGLVLSPTRELSVQISEQFEALGSSINLKSVVIVGGLDPQSQVRAGVGLGDWGRNGVHTIVATPHTVHQMTQMHTVECMHLTVADGQEVPRAAAERGQPEGAGGGDRAGRRL